MRKVINKPAAEWGGLGVWMGVLLQERVLLIQRGS